MGIISDMKNWVKSLLAKAWDEIEGLRTAIKNWVNGRITWVKGLLDTAISTVRGWAEDLIEAVTSAWESAVSSVRSWAQTLVDVAISAFNATIDTLKASWDAVSDRVTRLKNRVDQLVRAVADIGAEVIRDVRDFARGLINDAVSVWDRALSSVKGTLRDLAERTFRELYAIRDWLHDFIMDQIAAVTALVDEVYTYLSEKVTNLVERVEDLTDLLENPEKLLELFTNMLDRLW